ncbi:hypothetical protein Aduo_018882 [Ancylostoma duodenale]
MFEDVNSTHSLQSCVHRPTSASTKPTDWLQLNQPRICQKSSRTSPASTVNTNPPQNDVLVTLKEVLKSQSISEVRRYDGKRSLTDFLREIEVKYPRSVWSDSDRRDILLNHLEGTAKAHAQNLPVEILNGTFDGLVEQLRRARNTPCERLKAQADWKNLRKHENESVSDFCCRLQKIAKRMSPQTDCDFDMGSKLYECLSEWKDSYYMLAALDFPDGHVYEEVRKVAVRLERTRETTSSTAGKNWKPRSSTGKTDRKADPQSQQPTGSRQPPHSGAKGDNPNEERSNAQQSRDFGTRIRQRGPPKAPERFGSKSNAADTSSKQPKGSRTSFSTHLQSWCCGIKRTNAVTPTPAYGDPCHCNIHVFGMKAKALIDTGSVITIIPLGLLKKARNRGVNLDELVTMMDDGSDTQVYDASGNLMSFLMVIAATIQVEAGDTAKVQMHIQKSDHDVILIGTNALESLGIRVQVGAKFTKVKQDNGRAVEENVG